MDNRFQRTELLLGTNAVKDLSKAHIGIFGLGGVGAFAAESLARAGIGELTIIDFDTVGLTNINRQSLAFSDTVSHKKVNLMAERIERINEKCKVNKCYDFFADETSDKLLSPKFDAVIDAIDSFNPKIHLIVECMKRKIPLFAAMGAAGKIDPSKIKIGDISQSSICPLAKRVRKKLRTYNITDGFQVVFSIEPPIQPFDPNVIPTDKQDNVYQRGRVRMVQGTISYLPAIFGLMLSGMVIQHITGFKTARDTPGVEDKLSIMTSSNV